MVINIQEYEIIVHNDRLAVYVLIIAYKQPLNHKAAEVEEANKNQ